MDPYVFLCALNVITLENLNSFYLLYPVSFSILEIFALPSLVPKPIKYPPLYPANSWSVKLLIYDPIPSGDSINVLFLVSEYFAILFNDKTIIFSVEQPIAILSLWTSEQYGKSPNSKLSPGYY